ncbi:MTH1187 family thiamine-binding protein [Salinicola endophyticus]|uniref:MTH1187 family thiamine-binding protein n=1 Tax=Salinicola endophyticus TaxID=1949083 RepID=A0ABY8FID7_9GAMM|nr:MTH1187 family thiamine-binding protein [Salinicola endophyticus]
MNDDMSSDVKDDVNDERTESLQVIVDLCVVPLGVGVSVSEYVAACQRVIDASGLGYRMHAYGTNIEGPWDAVMAVVKACHERVHAMGAPRITTTLKLGTRTDREQGMDDKVASVEARLRPSQG